VNDGPVAREAPDTGALLRSAIGDVVLPTDPEYALLRLPWSRAADQRPAAIARPRDAASVARILAAARRAGLRVAPQSTGHAAHVLPPLDDAVLLRTDRMDAIRIDAAGRRARVGAGVRWGDLARAADADGLAGLAGGADHVGVAGYTLGGGLGWLARRFGSASASLVAASLVTADGEIRHVRDDHEPELLWALRGGGGAFGVVTELELELHPVEHLSAGALFWPLDEAQTVLTAWQAWTRDVPDTVTSIARLLRFPDDPAVPGGQRGQAFVLVEVACLGPEAETNRLLAPLRTHRPAVDTIAAIRPPELAALHMDPVEPSLGYGDGLLLDDLPPAAVDALLARVGSGQPTCLKSVEIRQLGGMLARANPDRPGVLGSLDAAFALFPVAPLGGPVGRADAEAEIAVLWSGLAPWASKRRYLNFAGRFSNLDAMFDPVDHARLRAVKERYDPNGLILATHDPAPGALGLDAT
jgi:hypothetical protein